MNNKLIVTLNVFVLLMCLSILAYGQETTGSIEITVKDPQGAVVPNASATVESSGGTTGYKRAVTTDENGFQRILQVPPGSYVVTIAASAGFGEKRVENIKVELGKVTPVNIELTIGSGTTVVDVNASGDVTTLDTTDTKIQTNISAQTAELLPKGTNFSSILKVSPATRPEPRSGQFQIDGATGSENTFIIDGQEVTNVRTGVLNTNSNLPFQLVQEVQIKSSGFEAEYGGATGGVINVVTKGGSNQWRGEFGMQFRPSKLNAVSSPSLRQESNLRPTPFAEYYPNQRDNYLEFNPSLNLSGPIIKDRVWFFASYTPQIFTRDRTINYLVPTTRLPTGRSETYHFKETDEYTFARIDAQPFSRIHLSGSYTYNPIIQKGGTVPAFSSALTAPPVLPGSNPVVDGAAYLNNTGGRQNSQSVTGQASWTISNKLIVTARAGHYFLNEKLGTYGQGNPDIARVTCSASSFGQFPTGFGCLRNQNNGIPVISNTRFDATKRDTFDVDATYLFKLGGRHELKGGYQLNKVGNQVETKTTDQIVLRWGWTVGSQDPLHNYSGQSIPSSPGALGAGLLQTFETQGNVTSKNEGIFIQDKWQPTRLLTLNLGLRTERENVPSFAAGLPGITFDFPDKMAPRLGAAYNLTGDGKTKLSVFYGWFYDRFKYELPRGSFGGDVYHNLYYEIMPGDTLSSFSVASITGGHEPIRGGACPGGTTTPVYGRVRCDLDQRISSNAGLPLDEAGGIDPDIKAFRQSEFTVTFERQFGANYLFSSRFTHKQVDHIIEDAGFPNSQSSEFYIIGNPGEGLYAQQAKQFGIQALKPERKYDALEFNINRRFAKDYFFTANYTYSRLVGNYSGLASSDEDGRLSPNVNRYFDQPQAGWTVAGGPDNGKLSTDRPHVLKFYGAYNFNWDRRLGFGKNNETSFQLFTTIQSGTPLTTTASVNGIDVVMTKRGDLGRTETFTQTDFAFRHRYKFGRDNRFTLIAEVDILNLFNEANETNRENLISQSDFDVRDYLVPAATQAACDAPGGSQQPCLLAGYKIFQTSGAASILTDASSTDARYPLFNLSNAFQSPREVRFGFRFVF